MSTLFAIASSSSFFVEPKHLLLGTVVVKPTGIDGSEISPRFILYCLFFVSDSMLCTWCCSSVFATNSKFSCSAKLQFVRFKLEMDFNQN